MKLRIFLILYTIIGIFCVFGIFSDHNGFASFGAAILLCGLAAVSAFSLLIAMLWDSANWRTYFWAMLWVGLLPTSIWIKDLRLFERNDEIQLKEVDWKK